MIGTLDRRRRQLTVLFTLSAAAAVAATVWQAAADADDERTATITGLIGAVAYSTGLLLKLGTQFGAALARVLTSMGRMALTNYITATIIAVLAAPALGLHHSAHYGRCSRWPRRS